MAAPPHSILRVIKLSLSPAALVIYKLLESSFLSTQSPVSEIVFELEVQLEVFNDDESRPFAPSPSSSWLTTSSSYGLIDSVLNVFPQLTYPDLSIAKISQSS